MSLPAYTPPPKEQVTWRTRRERFRAWRHSRPFWGGLWTLVAGWEMYALTAAPFKVVLLQGVAGISAILICAVFTLLAITVWVQPQLRVVAGFVVVFLAIASVLLTNLGGFLVGMLLGLHGGASMIAWKPFVQRWQRPTPATDVAPVTVLVERSAQAGRSPDAPEETAGHEGTPGDTTDAPADVTTGAAALDAPAPDASDGEDATDGEDAPAPQDITPGSDPDGDRPASRRAAPAAVTVLPAAPPPPVDGPRRSALTPWRRLGSRTPVTR